MTPSKVALLREVGDALEASVKVALAALEQADVPARDADEFIRECVFNAWWDWDYVRRPFTSYESDPQEYT